MKRKRKQQEEEEHEQNPYLVDQKLASKHCFGALGPGTTGIDKDSYNITCVYYGLRPAAILNQVKFEDLKWIDKLGLKYIPIVKDYWNLKDLTQDLKGKQEDTNVSVIVYDPRRDQALFRAQLLALLGASDSRTYSPSTGYFFTYNNPCFPVSKSHLCELNKEIWEKSQPMLRPAAIVGTLLGYNPERVQDYSIKRCISSQKKSEEFCKDQYEREQKMFETLLRSDSESHKKLLHTIKSYFS